MVDARRSPSTDTQNRMISNPATAVWQGRQSPRGLVHEPAAKALAGSRCPPLSAPRFSSATRSAPPEGLSHWSSLVMVKFIARIEKVTVSHHYVASLWRETALKPHRQGTFKLSRDPRFAEKVAEIVGLYLAPPGSAVVLSLDEKTQLQALDRYPAAGADRLRCHRETHPRLHPPRHHHPVRRTFGSNTTACRAVGMLCT